MPPAAGDRRARGEWAEQLAERHLLDAGLHTVARNYRCRRGELDLVMRDGGTLVFVEVRYRARQDFGGALESVDQHKIGRLAAAAEQFMAREGVDPEAPCRFDVMCIAPGRARPVVQWIRDAFAP